MAPDYQAPARVQAVRALAYTKDVEEAACFEFGQRLGADHATVGNNAYARYGKAAAQAIDHGYQCRHISGVAGPHLRTYRSAITIDKYRKDHLPKIGAVIFAEAVSAEGLPTRALKVEAGGVHEHQIKPGK